MACEETGKISTCKEKDNLQMPVWRWERFKTLNYAIIKIPEEAITEHFATLFLGR